MGHFHEHMFVGLITYVHKGGNICSLANEHMLPRTSVLHISLSHILSMTCIVRNSHRAEVNPESWTQLKGSNETNFQY